MAYCYMQQKLKDLAPHQRGDLFERSRFLTWTVESVREATKAQGLELEEMTLGQIESFLDKNDVPVHYESVGFDITE